MVPAKWSVPAARADVLHHNGRSVPSPVEGLVLIDTGATHTCIAHDVAAELGLHSTSFVRTHGAGGWHNNPEYFARLSFRVDVGARGSGVVEREHPAASIPNLNDLFATWGPPEGVQIDTPWRLIGLLGRDILRNMVLVFDGPNCTFELRSPH